MSVDEPTPPVEVALPSPLHEARFLHRPNRFLVRAKREGREILCHLPDPGRMVELLRPGARLWLQHHDASDRKTRWTVILVESRAGDLVSVSTTLPNRLIRRALEADALPELAGWRLRRAEVTRGRSRFDFLLGDETRELLLEVKSVSLIEDGEALFPDAITARGTRHVRELATLTAEDAVEAAVLFVVQRTGARRVRAARSIDPKFADALADARQTGVRVYGRGCRVEIDRVVLEGPLPVA